MVNSLKIVEILKWCTDEKHPMTRQAIELSYKNSNDDIINGIKYDDLAEIFGYKKTFRNRLFKIADYYNKGKKREDWKINFTGYDKYETNEHAKIGKIFYNHEIRSYELNSLIRYIKSSDEFTPEYKKDLIHRLIHTIGNKYYFSEYNNNNSKYTEFAPLNNDLTYYLKFLNDAIYNKKMITFKLTYLNSNKELKTINDMYMVSPYALCHYNGYYWLIGNKRLKGKWKDEFGGSHQKYSKTIDLFRVDKMNDLQIAKDCNEKRAKYFPEIEKRVDIISKSHVYEHHNQIDYKHVVEGYGKIDFKILTDNIDSNNIDFSFIYDTFGNQYEVKKEKNQITVTVYASNECFINWAMVYIDKIKILDTFNNASDIKKSIRTKLKQGLENL